MARYLSVAHQTAASAMAAMRSDPGGVFLTSDLADYLGVEPGDPVQVLFARGTKQQKLSEMRVIGLFERLPGFPEGADVLANLQRQVRLIPSTTASFFLARRRLNMEGERSGLYPRAQQGDRLNVEVVLRSKRSVSPDSRRVMIGRYSLKRPMRCSKSSPNARCSFVWLPAPMPRMQAIPLSHSRRSNSRRE